MCRYPRSIGVGDDRLETITKRRRRPAKRFKSAGTNVQAEPAVERGDHAPTLKTGDRRPVTPADRAGVGRAGVQPQLEHRLLERQHRHP